MHIDLNGKVALVTGAASAMGLGFATARMLGRAGAIVVLTDIAGDEVAARAAELQAEGVNAIAHRHDVTSADDWGMVVGDTIKQFGRLDILVNNAGIAMLHRIEVLDLPQWQRQIDINLTSIFLGCKPAIAQMRAQGGGSIINLSSIAGLVGIPGASAYAASKGGVRLVTKSLALECAGEGIRINSVHPGVIWTEMQQVAIRDNPAQYDIINASIPMQKMGEPDDIAAMITFLASDQAKYITGAEFVVDGGVTAQ